MKGILVVNEFLHSNKFNEIHTWLIDAAKKKNIQMKLLTNAELLVDLSKERIRGNFNLRIFDGKEVKPDFILFWDKDVKLANYLEQCGYPVFNSARAIEVCDDKSLTHLTLMKHGIPMPDTIIAPKTFENIGYTNYNFLTEVADILGFPMVIKECFGSFGQQVYLANDYDDLVEKVKKIGVKPFLFQKFVKSSFGRDIRLQVVGNKIVASMYRYSENGDFRANLTIGGKMKQFEPTKEQCDLALKCCELIGLDFAGVDLLFGDNGEPIVCEVNSNAHFKNIYDCTGVNAADLILGHISNIISD